MRELLDQAVTDERGLGGAVTLADDGTEELLRLASGDARRALTYLESAALGVDQGGVIDTEVLARAVDRVAVRYDRAGDQHYDVISAFIKSIRGSDVDAALHYLALMIEAGEDPRYIARRLIVHASEDVGMADPSALPVVVAAAEAVEFVGLPEVRINLAQAVIHLALAPKSNAVIRAIGAASDDVRSGRSGPVPVHLRDASYRGAAGLGHGKGYLYPHDFAEGIVRQDYLPEAAAGHRYYEPSRHGAEARYADRLDRIRAALDGTALARGDGAANTPGSGEPQPVDDAPDSDG